MLPKTAVHVVTQPVCMAGSGCWLSQCVSRHLQRCTAVECADSQRFCVVHIEVGFLQVCLQGLSNAHACNITTDNTAYCTFGSIVTYDMRHTEVMCAHHTAQQLCDGIACCILFFVTL